MRVRMVTLAAGPDGVWFPGSVVEMSTAAGVAMVAGGYAEAVDAAWPPPVETATDPAPVQAERRVKRK